MSSECPTASQFAHFFCLYFQPQANDSHTTSWCHRLFGQHVRFHSWRWDFSLGTTYAPTCSSIFTLATKPNSVKKIIKLNDLFLFYLIYHGHMINVLLIAVWCIISCVCSHQTGDCAWKLQMKVEDVLLPSSGNISALLLSDLSSRWRDLF